MQKQTIKQILAKLHRVDQLQNEFSFEDDEYEEYEEKFWKYVSDLEEVTGMNNIPDERIGEIEELFIANDCEKYMHLMWVLGDGWA